VLQHLAALCGDARGISFGEADLIDAAPLRTTMQELQDAGSVELRTFLSDPYPYALTIEGWFKAQHVSGRFDSPEFDDRRGRLCAAMKRAVPDRTEMALLTPDELAQAAGLPEGWVWNIFEANVLYRLDSHGRYRVRFENGLIYIPTTFGHTPG
jgi:hypothetical protein